MKNQACPVWNPDECDGSERCPPRCPRYVAPDGTPYTIHPADSRPSEADRELGSASGETFALRATADGESVGRATLSVEDAPNEASRPSVTARIDAAEGRPEVATELGRQLVAETSATGIGTVTVEGPTEALDRLAAELGVERDDEDDLLVVSTTDDSVESMTLPPAQGGELAAAHDLAPLVDPDEVAVVGATDREGAIGRVVVDNLLSSFDGDVIPITPRRDEVLGLSAPDGLADLDEPADLAVVVLPADAAIDAVREAGEAGVEAVAVLSAGFGETGDDGNQREAELREAVETYDLTLIGPNALGVLSSRAGLNASFSPTLPDAGSVSVVSHSGALITAVLDWSQSAGVGVRDVVSMGNAAGIDEAELLRYWGNDPGTDVIFAYLEDVADGDRFVEAVREVSRRTPVVVLKSGRSEAGARAAASHTGALAGDDAGFEAAFETTGAVRARSLDEAFDLTKAFARQPLPTGERVAVVTNAGGPGVLAADAIADADTELAAFSDATTDRLRESLPDAASLSNPVDVLGDADVDRFATALDAALADGAVDSAVVVSTPHPLVPQSDLVEAVGDASRRYGKPVVMCLSGGPLPDDVRETLADTGVPNYPDAERASRALDAMASYGQRRRTPGAEPERPSVDSERANAAFDHAQGDGSVLGVDAMDLLDTYDIPTPVSELVRSPEEATTVARRIGDEVVLKVASSDIAHKSDVGGVRVGVAPAEVNEAFEDVIRTVEANAPDADVEGVVVQEEVSEGVECLVGVTRHPRFGPFVTFGLGGVFVEHLEDVAHRLAPLSQAEAKRLIRSIDADSVLDGTRGDDPADVDALADAISRLSWLAVDYPVEELEVNPLLATSEGVVALDFHASVETVEREEADALAGVVADR